MIAQDCNQDPLFYDCFCLTYFHVGLNQHIFVLDLILLLTVIKIQILVGTVMKVQLSFWNFTVISYVRLKRVCLFDSSRINIDSTLLRWMKIDSTLLLKLCAHWNFVKCVCYSRLYKIPFKDGLVVIVTFVNMEYVIWIT